MLKRWCDGVFKLFADGGWGGVTNGGWEGSRQVLGGEVGVIFAWIKSLDG